MLISRAAWLSLIGFVILLLSFRTFGDDLPKTGLWRSDSDLYFVDDPKAESENIFTFQFQNRPVRCQRDTPTTNWDCMDLSDCWKETGYDACFHVQFIDSKSMALIRLLPEHKVHTDLLTYTGLSSLAPKAGVYASKTNYREKLLIATYGVNLVQKHLSPDFLITERDPRYCPVLFERRNNSSRIHWEAGREEPGIEYVDGAIAENCFFKPDFSWPIPVSKEELMKLSKWKYFGKSGTHNEIRLTLNKDFSIGIWVPRFSTSAKIVGWDEVEWDPAGN